MEWPRESELTSVARIADRLWASRPLAYHGRQPHRSRAGNGVEFLDYRDYMPGDDIRWLDWRATARARHPQVRRFHDEMSSDWVLCLDCSTSMTVPGMHKWQLAAQICAAMGFLLLHRGNRVGLALFSDKLEAWLPPGRGALQYRNIVHRLGRYTRIKAARGSNLGACLAPIQRLDSMLVISDFLAADGMRPDLSRCLQRGGEVDAVQVLSDDECAIRAPYPAAIADAEQAGEARLANQQDAQRALQRLQHEQQVLESFCLRQGIRYSCAYTNTGWRDGVVQHLMRNRNAHA